MKDFKKIYEENFNEKIVDVHRVKGGCESHTFFIKTKEKDTVLRIPKKERKSIFSGKYQLFRHFWASNLLEHTKVPISKVILVDVSNEIVSFNYLISQRVEGKALDFTKLTENESEKILKQIVIYLKEIHKIKIKDYGLLIQKNRGNKKSWGFVYDLAIEKLQKLKEFHLLGDEKIKRISLFFNQNKEDIKFDDSRLIHNDLSINHILVRDKEIVAIIDFGDAMGGDPVYDLARFYVLNLDIMGETRLKKVLDAYGNVDEKRFNYYLMYQACWYKTLQLKHSKIDEKYERVGDYIINKVLENSSS